MLSSTVMVDDIKKKQIDYISSILEMKPADSLLTGMQFLWGKDVVVTKLYKEMSAENYKTHKFGLVIVTADSDNYTCRECGIYCSIVGGKTSCLYDLNCDQYKIKDILE